MKSYIKTKIIIFFISATIFIAVISTMFGFSRSNIFWSGDEIAGYELYVEDDFFPYPAIMYEDEYVDIIVLTRNTRLKPPYIKTWFGYLNVPNALRLGLITVDDIRDSNASCFIFIDKLIVSTIMEADEIHVSIKNDATGPDTYMIPEQHWYLTGDDLDMVRELFDGKEFMDHGEDIVRGEYRYNVEIYKDSELLYSFYILQDGTAIKSFYLSCTECSSTHTISDVIDFEAFEELLKD